MTSLHFHHLLKMLLFLTLIIQPSLSVVPDIPTSELIGEICVRTPDTRFCQNLYLQNIKSSSYDIQGLVQISLNQVLINATNTLIAVKRAKFGAPKQIADLLTICEEGYTIVVNLYTDATFALAKKDIDSVLFDALKTKNIYSDCGNNINGPLPQFTIYNVQNLALQRVSVAAAETYKIGLQ